MALPSVPRVKVRRGRTNRHDRHRRGGSKRTIVGGAFANSQALFGATGVDGIALWGSIGTSAGEDATASEVVGYLGRVRAVGRSTLPQWGSTRFRLAPRTYAPWGCIVSGTCREPSEIKKNTHARTYYRCLWCAGVGALRGPALPCQPTHLRGRVQGSVAPERACSRLSRT